MVGIRESLRNIMIKCIAILVTFIVFVITPPSNAASGWKPLLGADNKPLHWYSCTVTYAVDLNGHSSKPVNTAIKNVESVSGLDFKRVGWKDADLKIHLTKKTSKEMLAYTDWWYSGSTTWMADIVVYKDTYKEPYKVEVDVYRHEIGHALGLSHIRGSDVMNARVIRNATRTGWARGLRTLYKQCQG
jgi:Matrixin